LTIVSHADRTADFGYVLNRKYWNAGYATCDTQSAASLPVNLLQKGTWRDSFLSARLEDEVVTPL
jgi:hypothetical protein